jgi:predicted ATPase
MKLTACRIKNFRSIADSDWKPLSEDGVTAIVGMNESGKTSLLEALSCTLGDSTIDERDFRYGCPSPEVFIELQLSDSEVSGLIEKAAPKLKSATANYFKKEKNKYRAKFFWEQKDNGYTGYVERHLDALKLDLDSASKLIAADTASSLQKSPVEGAEQTTGEAQTTNPEEHGSDFFSDLEQAIGELEPVFVLFSDDSGLLPDSIDVVDDKLKGSGNIGARNFLTVAAIDLKKLVAGSDIERVNLLKRATKKITADFGEFWSQHIGQGRQLELECEIQSKRKLAGESAGQPYLTFWITDGVNRLHPSQRSKGLRWFLSFYLQLRASEVLKRKRVFLLDEPGANLHETAQVDVLKLINRLSTSLIGLIYSTHSPHLIEPDRLHRILTVERASDSDESPSIVRSVLKDASSLSGETLSPIYTRMGVDFWRQTVIERSRNVLLEEPSALFYMKAFMLLCKASTHPCFIPCTGVNNLPQLAYMFTGWGLGFVVVVDDEPSGRSVYKDLKKNLFGDSDELAARRLLKIPDCSGIEDIFSTYDFETYILKNQTNIPTGKNSDYLKRSGDSKPVLACRFFLDVEKGVTSFDMLNNVTKQRISALVASLEAILN